MRWKGILIGAFSAMLAATPVFAASPSEVYRQAIQAYEAQDYWLAIDLMSQVAGKAGNTTDAYFVIGDSYRNIGNAEEAVRYLLGAYQSGSRRFETLIGLGYSYMDLGNYNAACPYLRQAATHWNNADAWWNLGLSCQNIGDEKCTIEAMDSVIRISPNSSPEPYVIAGGIYGNAGILGQELNYYMKGLKYFPSDAILLYHVGDVYYAAGKYEDAIPYLFDAIQVEPGFLEALYTYGMSCLKLGDLDAAAEIYYVMCETNKDADLTKALGDAVNQEIMKRQMEKMQEMQRIQDQIDQDAQMQQQQEEMQRQMDAQVNTGQMM